MNNWMKSPSVGVVYEVVGFWLDGSSDFKPP
jgi:hypothetical protein